MAALVASRNIFWCSSIQHTAYTEKIALAACSRSKDFCNLIILHILAHVYLASPNTTQTHSGFLGFGCLTFPPGAFLRSGAIGDGAARHHGMGRPGKTVVLHIHSLETHRPRKRLLGRSETSASVKKILVQRQNQSLRSSTLVVSCPPPNSVLATSNYCKYDQICHN